ncbi:N-acetylmuramoyl-L-alanine amidase [Salicibibacter cibarius]|uniref:N-acetylmuramoyl-L-alanine amidase n=1 Tax=Salicibibacter cibarius TaxID=2743000 RepID=A0A7T6Z6Z4_9BACI|nr:N-acetylmuramoyl-L-alanine amidase [Salicibibacter cibarius]QQK77931.1 N-acetylmuramoyl-L-alanine amidase [Salicibibacter cibarius]
MEIIEDMIPTSNSNRPGTSLTPTHVTVHETANTAVGADAAMHADYVKGDDAQDRQVSWHYTVDDTVIIQHLPTNEVGWHAGSEGNEQSVGIELCVNQDGNFEQTRARAVSLIQFLMAELDISLENVVTHQSWTGQNCPANLLNDWSNFINEISDEDGEEPSPSGQQIRVITDTLWVYDEPDWDARYTTVQEGEIFTVEEELTVNGSLMYQLRSGLYITGNPEYVEMME